MARASTLAIALVLPLAAAAEPIELKLSFFSSDQNDAYRDGVKPFVDAVNAEGKGLVTIKVHLNGGLGNAVAEQPKLVAEGVADIAWVVPGQTPYRFPDNQALELPGLFKDVREGTLVYTHLIAANALRGYEKFFVIGAYASAPTAIHSRKKVTVACLTQGSENPYQQFGGGGGHRTLRRHPDHYAGGAAFRRADARCRRCRHDEPWRFVSVRYRRLGDQPLPPRHWRGSAGGADEPQEIRQLAGSSASAHPQVQRRAAAATWIELYGATEQRSLDKIESDPARKAVKPSPADRVAAEKVFQSMIDAWAARARTIACFLKMIEADLATIRSTAQ